VTNDVLEEQRERLGDAAGDISRFADNNNAAMTPVQRLEANMGNLMFRFGGVAEAAGLLSAPIAAVGPTMMALNATQGLLSGALGSKIMPALGRVGTAFRTLGTVIMANPIFLIAALVIGIAILLYKFREEIIDALVGAWEFVKDKISPLIEWFRTAIPNAIAAVVDWIKDNWPLILAIITGPIGLAVKFIIDNWDKIKEGIRNAIEAVRRFVTEGFNRIRTTITNLISRIRDFVVDGFRTLKDRALGFVTDLREGISERITAIVDFVKGLPGRIVSGLGNLGGTLKDKGREMIQGFLDGATNLLKNIGRFLLDRIPGWIRSPFEKALGISSPSKVFAEIGRDTMAGFSVGVDDELRRVQRTMMNMASAIPLSAEMGFAGSQGEALSRSGGMGTNISVTVNNPAPEPASRSTSRELRKLAAIGVFGD
jgi:hypothetical protein